MNYLANAVYDILDEGIVDFDKMLMELRGQFDFVDEAAVFELANAYLEHYGKCVELC